jgi:colicin import membrane protein
MEDALPSRRIPVPRTDEVLTMAEKKESSVLFSLRELREIEEERIQEEHTAKKRAEEERIRAQQEAERRAREEEEGRRRAAEDAERRAREAVENREREERLRVEEAERRARVEAQAQLEQQRMHKELEIRAIEAQKKKPTWLIAVAGGLVLVVGILGFWAYNRSQEADKERRENEAKLAALLKDIDTTQAEFNRLSKETEDKYTKLLNAKTEEEKAAAARELEEAKRRQEAKGKALEGLKDRARKERASGVEKKDDGKIDVKCDPNDPLCGIK